MKRNKFSLLRVLACLLLGLTFIFSLASCASSGEKASWRTGLFSTLSLSVEGSNGAVTATVRNDLTVGLSTIEVYVYLYSVTESGERIEEAYNHTDDLNIFYELTASASTSGENKYWYATMRYQSNAGAWVEQETVPVLIDGRA
ncbi:MAG: hypothetical protein IJY26_04400 [Clostridia bacterium]|nr:hypothetical protein [Clostridia bacterium]